MADELSLWLLRSEGETQVGLLSGEEVIVGREVEGGITVDNHAISRHHGVFKKIKSHWIYKDLASTNGSWINGEQVASGRWRVVRAGDFVQLANTALQVRSGGDPSAGSGFGSLQGLGGRSLLVFVEDEFVDEYTVPEYGRALSIGGSQADLIIEGDIYELPSLVVERRGDKISAFAVARETPLFLNDEQVTDTVNLRDGDIVRIANYRVLFNDAGSRTISQNQTGASAARLPEWNKGMAGSSATLSSIPRPIRQSGNFAFGSKPAEDENLEETMALDPNAIDTKIPGTDVHPSMRYRMDESSDAPIGSLTDKLMILVGVSLFLVLILLVVAWMVLL